MQAVPFAGDSAYPYGCALFEEETRTIVSMGIFSTESRLLDWADRVTDFLESRGILGLLLDGDDDAVNALLDQAHEEYPDDFTNRVLN